MLDVCRRWRSGVPALAKGRVAGYLSTSDPARGQTSLRVNQFVLVLFAICFLFQHSANPEQILTGIKQVRRVVIFYELGLSSPAVALLDRELRATLDTSPFQIELYPEYFETTLFSNPADQKRLRDSFVQKYLERKPDLIIAVGPSPVEFMVENHERFFKNIPVVFGGTSEAQAGFPRLNSYFTGNWEEFEPAKTMDAALQLQPDTRHVVIVGGVSTYDRRLESIFRQQLRSYETRLEISFLTDLDMPGLLERLRHLPAQTVVMYSHYGMDTKGTRYIGASQAFPMIVRAANVPIYIQSDAELVRGGVGGYLQSFAREGTILGQIASRILNGTKPQDIAIVRGANLYMFDWMAMKRWGLRRGNLPRDSTVLSLPPSFLQRTKWVWVTAFFIILFLYALYLYLRLRRAKERQVGLSGMLINAQEKERSRLASEIHDDFSQRLALMILELEMTEETIAVSPDEAIQRVHNVLNSASEIGADLHTLSHRLHSSTLERLGLVPAVKALCQEFTIQQGIKVEFSTDSVPRSVHPDVALCLFRIVQEGLRNVKKHSRVDSAQVRLDKVGDRLYVFVSDEGDGFDISSIGNKEGLGILSMEERAHLLGGRFEINSKPGKGTRIEASTPHPPIRSAYRFTHNKAPDAETS
jgi:signal transduction histidine kinase